MRIFFIERSLKRFVEKALSPDGIDRVFKAALAKAARQRLSGWILGIGLSLFSLPVTSEAAPAFARGADVGWLSQMESQGRLFYDEAGVQKPCLQILQEHCINTIRLRVWVNPAGGWCGKTDVIAQAVRAKNMGFRILIDFHYSDSWADPGQQNKPAAWTGYNFAQLTQAVSLHTNDVLTGISAAGVTPEWVQVGNETNNGMLWEDGRASANMANFAALVDSGYGAVKVVFPSAKVIVHISNGFDNALFRWIFDGLRNNGARWDVCGMSLYPDPGNWTTLNTQCLTNMNDMVSRYNKDVMVVEVGMDVSQPQPSHDFVVDIINKTQSVSGGRGLGVVWWEPQAYNWMGYNKVCFGTNGRPTTALSAFGTGCTGSTPVATATFTRTPTRTFTRTNTPTFTATRTNTFTPTRSNTPTMTRTNTVTFTRTNTPTVTRTNTPSFTSTNTFTRTNTFTLTTTRTNTPTFTMSPTTTSTNTRTNTPTFTATNTYTATRTPTMSPTPIIPTNTPTNTATATRTFTPSFTSTLTSTSTNTLSRTPTPIFTNTRTNTPSFTMTSTFTRTNTPTNSSTLTNTYTGTASPTPTPTTTATSTFTNTRTNTPSFTLTNTGTRTNTPTSTGTNTGTFTNTRTNTVTFTSTSTPTSTSTYTNTRTNTPSFTPSFTNTRTNTPTDSFTPTNTSTGTTPPTNTPTNTATLTNTSTLTRTPTSTFTSTNTSSFTNTRTSTPTSTSTSTNTSTPMNTGTPTNTYTVTVSPTSTPTNSATPTATPTSTSTFTLTRTFTLSPTTTFTPTNTSTPTNTYTATSTPTSTSTRTFTFSPTPTVTNTVTVTFTPSHTSTASDTPTLVPAFTSTPNSASQIPNSVLYPNPATGPGPVTLQITLASPADDVKVMVFTTSFRKINEIRLGQVPAGTTPIALALTDKWGSPLANGIYYVFIKGVHGRQFVKLMVLR